MTDLFQHFREDERDFIEKVLGWKEYVLSSYSPKLTDFLDPREQEIVRSLIGDQKEVKAAFEGGTPQAERKRALLYPEYMEPVREDFSLTLFTIRYPSKFIKLEHRQILGALMSIGLKRSKYGDILMDQETVQLIAAEEMDDFLRLQLTEIGRTKVELRKSDFSEVIARHDEWTESSTTVSSLRLDAVLAAIYGLSRQKVQPLIQAGQVKLNWRTAEQGSIECQEGDRISVRGFGRSRVTEILGRTKKDKIRLLYGRQK
ncbi:RNA-binding protein [Bacillus sp. FJAT-42376]|uniref:YlmH family RNA-binding protein n=1 Tax=Bacillus sp. FJAT-42376 TaxID=2014076 RepID=UPI000F4FB6C9|nr:RNA-binding protein [Bacillus sp. FJAT-42376]AZB42854.1 RNA-binding protein [Bacillus sp. FJAT-42376]